MLCGIVWHRLGWVPLGIILSRVAVHVYFGRFGEEKMSANNL